MVKGWNKVNEVNKWYFILGQLTAVCVTANQDSSPSLNLTFSGVITISERGMRMSTIVHRIDTDRQRMKGFNCLTCWKTEKRKSISQILQLLPNSRSYVCYVATGASYVCFHYIVCLDFWLHSNYNEDVQRSSFVLISHLSY